MREPSGRFDPGESIYDFLRRNLDEIGRLRDPDVLLPDDDQLGRNEISWAPGALDGVFGHHTGTENNKAQAAAIADALANLTKSPSRWNIRRLRRSLGKNEALGVVDDVISRLVEINPSRDGVRAVGRWLATTASSRDPVKLGIALIGIAGAEQDVAVLRTLGAHDEFTLYAATAFGNGLEDPESELWALATVVDGWGRIECVERLANTADPAIRSWILRTGYRNSIMYEYLAWIAATTGDLLGALSQDSADRELLTAAAEIIEALISGGPARDMDDYDGGAAAVTAYVAHLDRTTPTLDDGIALIAIKGYLEREDAWDAMSSRGWTATVRDALEQRCRDLLGADHWSTQVHQALASNDEPDAWRAARLAEAVGIDVVAEQLRRIEIDPFGGPWFDVWRGADKARAEQLCGLARRLLRPDELATGAEDDLGFGPDRRAHLAFEWSLQALRHHPGVGHDLLLAGLRQPGIRSRNMALAAFQHWTPQCWPPGSAEAIEQVVATDPVDKVREFAAEVLSGKPVED